MKPFKAYRLEQVNEEVVGSVKTLTETDLPEGEVLVKVHYSGINYKDAMANMTQSPIVKHYPFTPGIDLAGEVVESIDDRFSVGDKVIVTSYELGVSHDGGFSEYQRVKAEWVVPLPEGLTLKQAMILGTAGLTAALSVDQLEQHQIDQALPVLVTGATGGVGSISTAILNNLGYRVAAMTGKSEMHDWLMTLGAESIVDREAFMNEKPRVLDREQYSGAVEVAGGDVLSRVLTKVKYNGTVSLSGLTAGVKVPATVYPFILRGIHLAGIDSVYCPIEKRKAMWQHLSTKYKLSDQQFDQIGHEVITLADLSEKLPQILSGGAKGRYLVSFVN